MFQKIKLISILIGFGFLAQSCAVVGLIQSKKQIEGDFVKELKPKSSIGKYDMSINVIQLLEI